MRTIVDLCYPDGITCPTCSKVTKHYPLTGRKVYSCSRCGHQVSPMVGTIFEATKVPLQKWFYAIYLMATNKAGTSAAQLQRELGVKYDTAWRMMHAIRTLMTPTEEPFTGEVELDETFIHANVYKRSSARKRYGMTGSRKGEVVFGMLERSSGRVKTFHVKAAGSRILIPLIRKHVSSPTLIHTDGYLAYRKLPVWGYEHRWTDHGKHQYYTPESSTQRMENFWSTWKPRMKAVYKTVSPQYLQAYSDEYSWRYSNRNKPSMFWSLMCSINHSKK